MAQAQGSLSSAVYAVEGVPLNSHLLQSSVTRPGSTLGDCSTTSRHIRTRAVRPNEFLDIQTVTFATVSQRDQFLKEQKNAVAPIMRKRKQGCYGSHPRHGFNRKP